MVRPFRSTTACAARAARARMNGFYIIITMILYDITFNFIMVIIFDAHLIYPIIICFMITDHH